MSLTTSIPSTSPFDDFFEVDLKQVKEYGKKSYQDGPIGSNLNCVNKRGLVEKKKTVTRTRVPIAQTEYWLDAATFTQFSFDEQQLEEYGQTI